MHYGPALAADGTGLVAFGDGVRTQSLGVAAAATHVTRRDSAADPTSALAPRMARNSAGQSVLVWQQPSNAGREIYAQVLGEAP